MSFVNLLICYLLYFVLATFAAAQPVTTNDAAQVEIVKQRLIKFVDDTDTQRRDSELKPIDKNDEAKRILKEIAKINEALGYVKKQTDTTKVPPILDSSQYLYPNPSYSPFQSHNHQVAGSNGETLLLPSIRAIDFSSKNSLTHKTQTQLQHNLRNAAFNLPVKSPSTSTSNSTQKPEYYFRPHEVHTSSAAGPQLSTHFVIPVHRYKLNKEEYLQQQAAQEYRIKGYKIVGDIDNFYGKTKTTNAKHATSPNYHLYLLPRELALNDAFKDSKTQQNVAKATKLQENISREEKLNASPYKAQQQQQQQTGADAKQLPAIIKKRVVTKPLRQKGSSLAQNQHLTGGTSSASATVNITPPSIGVNPQLNAPNDNNNNNNIPNKINTQTSGNQGSKPNGNAGSFNLFSHNNNTNNSVGNRLGNVSTNQNQTASNVIKTAFQNIFKLPFQQQLQQSIQQRPLANDANVQSLEAIPLQVPQKFPASLQPQIFLGGGTVSVKPTRPINNDYHWEEDSVSDNSSGNVANAADEDNDYEGGSTLGAEKIWGFKHDNPFLNAQKEIQKDALKQGGIIIQKLKVRKGGIAIAGPGGVATAGSGGTAIVGPGGYALTHPRSLTIAGPGAKVIAIPANVDLKDALSRTNLQEMSFPREGKIVATGPTVYFSPDV